MKEEYMYEVSGLTGSIKIDGDWFKSIWKNINTVEIKNHMGNLPGFIPEVKAKMMYDPANLYLIFLVKDKYVRCITKEINGPVWEDSCVEFFFSPDIESPEHYFNLEVNCGGTPLMHYNLIAGKDIKHIDPSDIKKIEIAHSMPSLVDPEITGDVNWTIEYRIPLELIRKYSVVTAPGSGIAWRANFYKIAEINSNPHYLTWSEVNNPVPDFHLPRYFGTLKFK